MTLFTMRWIYFSCFWERVWAGQGTSWSNGSFISCAYSFQCKIVIAKGIALYGLVTISPPFLYRRMKEEKRTLPNTHTFSINLAGSAKKRRSLLGYHEEHKHLQQEQTKRDAEKIAQIKKYGSHIDLISQQNFSSITLPAAVSTCRQQKSASRVHVQLGNNAGTMTRDE